MAGQISWQLSFEGIDVSITKLERVNNLLASINSKGGINALNSFYNGGTGRGGNNIIVPGGKTSIGAAADGAIAGGVIAASSGTSDVAKLNLSIKQLEETYRKAYGYSSKSAPVPAPEFTKKMEEAWNRKIDSIGSSMTGGLPKSGMNWKFDASKTMEENQTAFGAEFEKMPGIGANWGDEWKTFGYQNQPPAGGLPPFASQYSSPIGPNQPNPPVITLFDSIKQLFRNITSGSTGGGLFGILRGLGSLSGGSGGLRGVFSVLGGIAKLEPVLLPILAALGVAFIALRIAVRLLSEGIKEAAAAYRNAAKAGKGISDTFAANSAFSALGVSGVDLSKIPGNGKLSSGQILDMARGGQFGDQNELLNMATQFQFLMRDAAQNAREMESASKASLLISVEAGRLQREWKTLLAQLAESIGPELIVVMEVFINQLKTINFLLELYKKLSVNGLILKLLEKGGGTDKPNFQNFSGGTAPSFTAWEKLGFVFNGPKPEKQLSDISRNTRDTVSAIQTLTKFVAGGGSSRGGGASGEWPSLPAMP